MAKKNPAVLWNVDQTGDVIGAAGRQRAQKNIGITDGEGKLIGQSATNSFMTSITLDDSNELKAVFGRPTLANLTPDTDHKNFSIGTNSETGAIEAQDLKNPSSSTDGNGTTYVSSVQQASNGKVSYKTQTITRATDDTEQDPDDRSQVGITPLLTTVYASNQPVKTTDVAVTPKGVWNAIETLDVDNLKSGDSGYDEHKSHITGFGADKTLATLTETDGKIAATFQTIEIGGGAVKLGAASQAVVTDGNNYLTTENLSNVTSSAETTTGTTYVSSISQTTTGQVSYKTQTITEATDESNSAKKGITTLTSDLYANNTRTTGHTTAVTPDGVWDAIDSLDVNNITGFGVNQTLKALSETNGKISAEFQAIAIDGGAVTLNNENYAVVTDNSKNLTTQDLSDVTSEEATPRTGTIFVSSISQSSAGQVSYKTQYIPSIPTSTSDLDNDSGFISSTSAGNHKYLTTNGSGVATWLDKPIQRAYYNNGNLAHDYADAIEILEVENSPNRKVSLLSNSVTSDKGYLVPTPIANRVLTTDSNGDISWQNATGGSQIQVQYTQTPYDVSNLLFNPYNYSINADNNALGFYVPGIPSGLTEPLLGSFDNRPSWVDGSPIVAGDYVTINEIADNKVEIGVNTNLQGGLATNARLSGIHSSLSYQIAGVSQTAEANLWRETVTACDATLDYYDPEEAHPGEDVPGEKKLGAMNWIKLCEIEYVPDAPYYTEIVAHFNVLGKFSSWHNANSAVFIAEVYAGITVQTASADLWVVNCGGKVVHNTAQTYANEMSIELYQSDANPHLVGVLLHCPNAENNYSRVHVEGSVHVVKGDADNVEIDREVGIDTGTLNWPAWNYVDPRSGHGHTLLKKVFLAST